MAFADAQENANITFFQDKVWQAFVWEQIQRED